MSIHKGAINMDKVIKNAKSSLFVSLTIQAWCHPYKNLTEALQKLSVMEKGESVNFPINACMAA
jgi:hypothetical protein